MSDTADSTSLHRSFVTVEGAFGTRQVHYRRGGRGPVVLLLHQSPQSSREMEPLIRAWGHAFTLIAPDSPGYGSSQPLQRAGKTVTSASMEDLAAATLEFADALQISRFGVYGFHTGASIAVALATAAPGRVAAVAANGLVVLTEPEREAILRDYFPPLVPRWDGSHLAWLWARMREQTIFFPWHDRRAATRMDFDVPPADRLHAGVLEFLAAGDHYPVAYAAAFADRAERRLPAMRVPLLITASARDPLAAQLDRIGDCSTSVRVERSADPAEALNRAFAHLQSHPGPDSPLRRVTTGSGPGHDPRPDGNAYCGLPGRQIRLLRIPGPAPVGAGQQPDPARTVVLLHAPGSTASAVRDLALDLARCADVLAADLPGHGASDPPPRVAPAGGTLDAVAGQLAEALAPLLPGNPATVVGIGASAVIASELARRLSPTVSAILLTPPAWTPADRDEWLEQGLPTLTPLWHGGHLLEAWHMVRDGRLYSPWFRREYRALRPGEPDLDDGRLHRDVGDLLRANGTWQALLRDILLHPPRPVATGGPRILELPAVPANWAEALRQAHGGRPMAR